MSHNLVVNRPDPGARGDCPRCGRQVFSVPLKVNPLRLETRVVAGLALRDLSPVAVYPFHPENCI